MIVFDINVYVSFKNRELTFKLDVTLGCPSTKKRCFTEQISKLTCFFVDF